MSISEQVSTLRELAELQNIPYHKRIIKRAADTIESLSGKLQAANMELGRLREVTMCHGEWIYCGDKDHPPIESGEYRVITNCEEVFVKLNFDVSDGTWFDDGGQYHDVIAWWKEYPYEI